MFFDSKAEYFHSLKRRSATACFSAIIVMQIMNAFLCKIPGRSLFSANWLDNRIILWGIALEVMLLIFIDYTKRGNLIFGTLPIIAPDVWLFAFGIITLEEFRKFIVAKVALK
jgi:sodium/potassium-transporting ATPase subunit alpha